MRTSTHKMGICVRLRARGACAHRRDVGGHEANLGERGEQVGQRLAYPRVRLRVRGAKVRGANAAGDQD